MRIPVPQISRLGSDIPRSGLGYGICCRLIDEFLATRPTEQRLYLIPTTRTQAKADDTLTRLKEYIAMAAESNFSAMQSDPLKLAREYKRRIAIEPVLLDLCDLVSVAKAAKRVGERLKRLNGKLDVLVANAGIGGWNGLDWGKLIHQAVTSPNTLIRRPRYKVGLVGSVCNAQLQAQVDGPPEEPLGEVFTANVFGHYMLIHGLAGALSAHGDDELMRGRVIWMSSLEAYDDSLSMDDLQGLKTNISYESSKRLTDVLTLTSDLPETREYVERFFTADSTTSKITQAKSSGHTTPQMYLVHPGLCRTDIMPVHWSLDWLWLVLVMITRVLGGDHWQNCWPYTGATAAVWLALAEQPTLDKQETAEGKAKWGSAVSRLGSERALRTEVDGWGFGGIVGEKGPPQGRWGNGGFTAEKRVEFAQLGRNCWRSLEELRAQWEKALAGSGNPI